MKSISLRSYPVVFFFVAMLIGAACDTQTQQQNKAAPSPAISSTPSPSPLPEITNQLIRATIIGKTIKDIPSSAGGTQAIGSWVFEQSELKEIDLLEKAAEKNKVTLIVNIRTATSWQNAAEQVDADNPPNQLEGKLRLYYEFVNGEWVLLNVENLTVKWRRADKKEKAEKS